MYYFTDEKSLTVIERVHLYNAESLDGTISPIEDKQACLIIGHRPTKKFNYEVWIKDEIYPQEGLERIEKLGSKEDAEPGEPFYSLVDKDRFSEYVEANSFILREDLSAPQKVERKENYNVQKADVREVSDLEPKDKESAKSKSKRKADSLSNYKGVKLQRDNEAPIVTPRIQ